MIPKRVFIIPYRNRCQQKFFFCKYMSFLLEHDKDYEIYFSHQVDKRPFNRGAVKNIGFLAIKQKYPNDYKDINFIFHDIDTVPFHKLFNYTTELGVIKHYYGFDYALGGIVVIKGKDFESTMGYPNYWGWGMEDNVLQTRANNVKLIIDRTQFYKIGSPEIIQLFDGITRIINKHDPYRAKYDNLNSGLHSISDLKFIVNTKSTNNLDNKFTVDDFPIFYINILNFKTEIEPNSQEYYEYDLREPQRKIINPNKLANLSMQFDKTGIQQKNISYIPTSNEKQELINKYGYENAIKIINYNEHNSTDLLVIPPSILYSSEYAKNNGIKPKATTSVSIGMGGLKKN
uniref:Galactosyltransferase C-terminal domain-containing protein n=1 Tax=viral metagenome TaxID=1070528 RepID=A0A6C0H6P2_9ZZZZ